MGTAPDRALKAFAVYQGEEQLEILILPVVGRGSQQEEMPGDAGEKPSQLKAFCIAYLSAPKCGGHFVRLVYHDEVPFRYAQFLFQSIAPCQLIQPGNAEVHFREHIPVDSGLRPVVGQDVKTQVKAGIQFILPLFAQASRRYNQASLQVPANHQFFDEQSSHDSLARARIIRQDIPEGEPGKHLLIDSGNLVGQGFHGGRMDGKIWVEDMREVDAIGF